jgi:hypothetical protein
VWASNRAFPATLHAAFVGAAEASSTAPLACLTWLLPGSGSCVWSYGFDHPPAPFDCAKQLGLGVFRERPERGDKSPFIGYSLGLHLRDRLRASGSAAPGLGPPLCVECAHVARPTGVGRDFAEPRLPRFRVPRAASPLESGTRGCPQHLPPMVFLRPSTDCSSRRLACLVSYRHHLWDSKNTNN